MSVYINNMVSCFVSYQNHPLWTAKLLKDNPSAIKKAHKSFLNAGCHAIITASYQASIEGFVKHCNVSAQVSC